MSLVGTDENVLMLSKDGSRTYPIRKQGKSKDKWTKKFYHINADALKEYAPCSDETEDKKRELGIFRQYGVWNKRKSNDLTYTLFSRHQGGKLLWIWSEKGN